MFWKGRLGELVRGNASTVMFAGALAARLLVWWLIPVDWNWDSYHHWQISYLSLKIGFGRGRLWDLNGCEYFWGMVPHLAQSALIWVLGTPSILPYRMLNTVLGGVNAVQVYMIGKRFYSERTGLVSGALFAVFPVAAVFDVLGMQDTMALTFLLASLLVMRERPFWSGAALALAGHSRVEFMAVGFIILFGYCLRELLYTESLPYLIGWLAVTAVFGFHIFAQTGNPFYPLYTSLYNVFGGWEPGNEGRPFMELMLGWIAWKLSVWPRKPTGVIILTLGASALYMVPHMARRRWLRYQPQLYLIASATVLTPLFITYLGSDVEGLLIMLRMVNPIAAFGFPVLVHLSNKAVTRYVPGARLKPEHVAAVVLLASYVYLIPAYSGFQRHTVDELLSGDAIGGLYRGGTVVCDHPTINYRLITEWGVEPEHIIGNHYSPAYYGVDDASEYVRWLGVNNVTLWVRYDYRSAPVWAAVHGDHPELLMLMCETPCVEVYAVDRAALEAAVGNS
ncbi:glycosyltransferase family 39 protein [Candidatus Bathyarchaeota archaeon]|nr:glycosyltransferase family 39 protein [Candidatus Bathyarchaeota archaeon]